MLWLTLCLLSGSVLAQPEPPLAACWHFDEPAGQYALDASGAGLDATLVGATRVPGVIGGAVSLSGLQQAVVAEGVGPLPEGGVEAWVRQQAPGGGQAGFVCFGNDLGGKNDAAILGYCGSLSPDRLVMGFCPSEWQGAVAATTLPLGEWVHLAAAWGREGVALYVDGVQIASSAGYTQGLPAHQKVLMGAGSWGGFVQCQIDEVRIYAARPAPELWASHAADTAYAAQPPTPKGPSSLGHQPIVDAGEHFDPASPTCGLQEAIDALSRRGGIVTVPPGTYLLKRSLRLRGNMTLRGSGPATILRKAPEVMSPLAVDAPQGATSVEVRDASGFELGAEVAVMDREMRGWYVTHALVQGKDGNRLLLDRGIAKPCMVERGAMAIGLFPAVVATGVSDVCIADLRIEGDLASQPTESASDFTCAAVNLVSCTRPRVDGVTVHAWPSDGIGVQGGSAAIVTGCVVEDCRGHGYHPGTGLRSGSFVSNAGRHNQWDGLYFCADVRYTTVSGCVFADNGWSGIGGLGNGGDRYNACVGNTCSGNGLAGIQMNDGRDNMVSGNVCVGNSMSSAGSWAGITIQSCTDCLVQGNRCGDDQEQLTQRVGISERGQSDRNLITGNHLGGAEKPLETVGPGTQVTGNVP